MPRIVIVFSDTKDDLTGFALKRGLRIIQGTLKQHDGVVSDFEPRDYPGPRIDIGKPGWIALAFD